MKRTVKISKVETVKAGKVDRIILHYELTEGPKKGEVWKIGALAVKLDENSRTMLKTAKEGDMVDITITKEGAYWNLTKVETVGSTPTYTKSYTNNNNTKSNDDHLVGIKVGAARNQAIAFLSATKGNNFTLDDIDDIAYEIVTRQALQEKTIKSGNNPSDREQLNQETITQDFDSLDDDFGF